MVQRPHGTNPFEFVVVSGLRAAQLMRGCRPRVAPSHKSILTAQLEVSAGMVTAEFRLPAGPAIAPMDPRKHVASDYVRTNR